jgi:signal transduction histidine kinase
MHSLLCLAAQSESTDGLDLRQGLVRAQRLAVAGRLATEIAHDLNNLLTVILGEVAVAKRAEHRHDEALGEIQHSAERASVLVRELLGFAGRHTLEPASSSIEELFVGVRPMLDRLAGDAVMLVMSVEGDVGRVAVTRSHLEQVLANLTANARDAMPQGGTLSIKACRATGDGGTGHVEIDVVDSGTGMSDDVKEHLFEPFFTTKERGSGTGLGLATSQELLLRQGGRIVVESELGQGSTIRLLLPLWQEDSSKPGA